MAAKILIGKGEEVLLENTGIRSWKPLTKKGPERLTLVTSINTPAPRMLQNISKIYRQATGTEIKIALYSTESISDLFSHPENLKAFDIIRTDVFHLPWFAEKVLYPLSKIDSRIDSIFDKFLPGLNPIYSRYKETVYALPSAPSAELLFYRRDLFESTVFCRQYYEEYGEEFKVPASYEEFNRIARFFTREQNPHSPVEYGTGIVMWNSALAAREYLSRFFSYTDKLYDDKGNLCISGDIGVKAMQDLLDLRGSVDPHYYTGPLELIKSFAGGTMAMAKIFSESAGILFDRGSKVSSVLGYAMTPGNNPLIGGSIIGVCRYSKHKEEALDFIKWLSEDTVSGIMTGMGGPSPCKAVYENYELIDAFPWLDSVKGCFAASKTSLIPPNFKGIFDETKFLNSITTAVHSVFNGIQTPAEALRVIKDMGF
jgi:multiple sugar transport system substrate-binding protein